MRHRHKWKAGVKDQALSKSLGVETKDRLKCDGRGGGALAVGGKRERKGKGNYLLPNRVFGGAAGTRAPGLNWKSPILRPVLRPIPRGFEKLTRCTKEK